MTVQPAAHFRVGDATMTATCTGTRLLAFLLCLAPVPAFLNVPTLSSATIDRLVLGAAGGLSEGDALMLERKAKLRELLSASERQIDLLVRFHPHVLEMRNAEDFVRSAMALLQKKIGMNEREARHVFLRSPYSRLGTPLGQSLEELEAKLDWFRSRLKLNKRNLRRLITTMPTVLHPSLGVSMLQIDALQASLTFSRRY